MATAIEVHQNLFRRKFKDLNDSLMPKAPIPSIDISVGTGLHAGFTSTLSRRSFTIGSGSGCDLVLLDDNIKDLHATISISQSVFGCAVQIESTQSDVKLDDVAIQPKTPSPFDTLPAKLSLGSVEVCFAAHDKAKPKGLQALGDVALRASVIIMVILLILIGLDLASQPVGNDRTETTSIPDAEVVENTTSSDLTEALRNRIAEAGLAEGLTVTETPEALFVTGRLSPEQMNRWQLIHKWFDAQPNAELLSTNLRSAPILEDFPAVASIKLSGSPQVRFLNGRVARVGDTVQNGWKVISISAEGLKLQNGNEIAQITF